MEADATWMGALLRSLSCARSRKDPGAHGVQLPAADLAAVSPPDEDIGEMRRHLHDLDRQIESLWRSLGSPDSTTALQNITGHAAGAYGVGPRAIGDPAGRNFGGVRMHDSLAASPDDGSACYMPSSLGSRGWISAPPSQSMGTCAYWPGAAADNGIFSGGVAVEGTVASAPRCQTQDAHAMRSRSVNAGQSQEGYLVSAPVSPASMMPSPHKPTHRWGAPLRSPPSIAARGQSCSLDAPHAPGQATLTPTPGVTIAAPPNRAALNPDGMRSSGAPEPSVDGREEEGSMETWSAHRVRRWLDHIGLAQHAASFCENGVDGAALVSLSHADLMSLGVERPDQRAHILRWAAMIHEDEPCAPGCTPRKLHFDGVIAAATETVRAAVQQASHARSDALSAKCD